MFTVKDGKNTVLELQQCTELKEDGSYTLYPVPSPSSPALYIDDTSSVSSAEHGQPPVLDKECVFVQQNSSYGSKYDTGQVMSKQSKGDENSSICYLDSMKTPFHYPYTYGLMLPPQQPNADIQKKKRRIQERLRLSVEQRNELEQAFKKHEYPDSDFMEGFEKRHSVPIRKIRGWFQNRRARERRQLMKHRNHDLQTTSRHLYFQPQKSYTELKNSTGFAHYYHPILPPSGCYPHVPNIMVPYPFLPPYRNTSGSFFSTGQYPVYNKNLNAEISRPEEPDSTNDAVGELCPSSGYNDSVHYDISQTETTEHSAKDNRNILWTGTPPLSGDKHQVLNSHWSVVNDSYNYSCSYGDPYAYVLDLSVKSKRPPSPRINNNGANTNLTVDENNNSLDVAPVNGIRPLTSKPLESSILTPIPVRLVPASFQSGPTMTENEIIIPGSLSETLNDVSNESERMHSVLPQIGACPNLYGWPPLQSQSMLSHSSPSAFVPYGSGSYQSTYSMRPPLSLGFTELGFETPPHFCDNDFQDNSDVYEMHSQKILDTPPRKKTENESDKNIESHTSIKSENQNDKHIETINN